MDITQTRQIEQDVLPFVDAVQWDEATPIQLLGTGSQQAQKYPSDIDLFSAIKRTKVDDLAGIYNTWTPFLRTAMLSATCIS